MDAGEPPLLSFDVGQLFYNPPQTRSMTWANALIERTNWHHCWIHANGLKLREFVCEGNCGKCDSVLAKSC